MANNSNPSIIINITRSLLTRKIAYLPKSLMILNKRINNRTIDAGFGPIGSIEELLDWFVEDFISFMSSETTDLIKEYRKDTSYRRAVDRRK